MKVEIKIDPTTKEDSAVFTISKLTPNLEKIITDLQNEGQEFILTGSSQGKTYLIDFPTIEIIRSEGKELILYNKKKERFTLSLPLYKLETLLPQHFIRISKSSIINIHCIDHVNATYNGTMTLVTINGIEDIITRSYRKNFKSRLGV